MKQFNVLQEYQAYYSAAKHPNVVAIPEAKFISILGNGSPGTNVFYRKKKALKAFVLEMQAMLGATDKAFSGSVVEIFYWYDEDRVGFVDIGEFYTTVDLDLLHYRIAIRLPDFIAEEDVRRMARQSTSDFAQELEYFTYEAGKCVQMLHLGPFAGELETLPVLQQFATLNGLRKSGMHHEIHLTDFEQGQSQEHLQTILRDPVADKTNEFAS